MVLNDLEVFHVSKLGVQPLNISKFSKWILSSSEKSNWHLIDFFQIQWRWSTLSIIFRIFTCTEEIAIVKFLECFCVNNLAEMEQRLGWSLCWESSWSYKRSICIIKSTFNWSDNFFECSNPLSKWWISCFKHGFFEVLIKNFIKIECISNWFNSFNMVSNDWKILDSSKSCNWSKSNEEIHFTHNQWLVMNQSIKHLSCSLRVANICDFVLSRKLSCFVDLRR